MVIAYNGGKISGQFSIPCLSESVVISFFLKKKKKKKKNLFLFQLLTISKRNLNYRIGYLCLCQTRLNHISEKFKTYIYLGLLCRLQRTAEA